MLHFLDTMNSSGKIAALLAIATVFLYIPVAQHRFLEYDDSAYVTDNPHVRTGLSLDNLTWAFTTFHEGNWHPVTWISHMLDCQLFGLNPKAHHLVNVAVHAANVVLLFILLQAATGAMWRSCLVAALFAVHPLNVETVAWVAERKSLLSVFFSLVTIALYGWYVRGPDWKKYLLVVLGFGFALMAKPMAVTLPLLMLLLDYWPLQRYQDLTPRHRLTHLLAEKLPLLFLTAASSAVTIVAQDAGGAISNTSIVPVSLRIENALVSYLAYIGKALWPVGLSPYYPHPGSLRLVVVVASAIILATITAAVFYARRMRYLVVGWFLFVVTLVPVIGIVQVGRQAMADRYSYIPCIGLFLIFAWGLGDISSMAKVGPAIALCLIVALAAATTQYLRYWQNGVTLFTRARTVAARPDWMIEEFLADSLLADGRVEAAFQHFRDACTLRPDFAYCHYNMAEILFTANQLRDALEQYQLARRVSVSKEMTVLCLVNSGEILLTLGDPKNADMQLSAALEIDPANVRALALRQQVH